MIDDELEKRVQELEGDCRMFHGLLVSVFLVLFGILLKLFS